jgi:hypothetical protein
MLALRITGSMLRAGHALLASQWKISPAPDSFATTEVAVDLIEQMSSILPGQEAQHN